MRDAIRINTSIGLLGLGRWFIARDQDGADIAVIEELSNEAYPETPASGRSTLRVSWVLPELHEMEQDYLGELTDG